MDGNARALDHARLSGEGIHRQIRLSPELNAQTQSARTEMMVDELLARFPEVPRDLRDEPALAKYVAVFGPLLRLAQKPSPCVGDGGATLDQHALQPATFACTLVPRKAPGEKRAGCG